MITTNTCNGVMLALAKKYIKRIKNNDKRAYAEAFLKFCIEKGPDPRDGYRNLSYLAKQSVWMQLAEYGIKEPNFPS